MLTSRLNAPSPPRGRRPGRNAWLATGLALASLAPIACGDQPDLTTVGGEAAGTGPNDPQKLIGGFAANDPRLDSIGSLVLISPYGTTDQLCGAAIITPESVLTAKHCAEVIPLAYSFGFKVGFGVGPSSQSPRMVVELAGYELAPGDVGGFVDIGRDVAVLHLEHPINGIAPVVIGALSDDDLGKAFAAIGYGIQDNAGSYGTRRLGKQTLKGREGRTLEHLFATFEAFLEWLETGNAPSRNLVEAFRKRAQAARPSSGDDAGAPGADAGAPDGGGFPGLEEIARQIWEFYVLEKDYEVVTGGYPGDAQACFGDSGSPLIKHKDGHFVAYGVVSGGLGTNDLICDLGAVYATFGPEVAAFIETAKKWEDACGDLDTKGVCEGNVAKRCTNVVEGRRRVVDFDCGLVGMECNTTGGQVSCDANRFEPPGPRRPVPMTTPPQIRQMVDRVFKAGSRP